MFYKLKDVQTNFGPGVLDEALYLIDSGPPITPMVQRGGELVTAVITNPGSKPFRVYVRVRKNKRAKEIAGECTCYERRNCKHVAAVLLKALLDAEEISDDVFDTDLSPRRGTSKSGNYERTASVRQRLTYVLQLDDAVSDGVAVETLSARVLRSGGYGETHYYDPSSVLRGAPPRFLSPLDRELLAELAKVELREFGYIPHLSGLTGERLLARVLETDRCYFEDLAEPPLRRGAPRRITFRWSTDESGNQSPAWTFDPEASHVFLLAAPWYLDGVAGICGPVETDLPNALAVELLRMPPVAPRRVTEVQNDLRRRFPGAALAPLRKFEIVRLPPTPPTPCLRLLTETIEEDETTEVSAIELACLSFDYDGIRIGGFGAAVRVDGERVVQAQRNEVVETRYRELLEGLGFEYDDDFSEATGDERFFLSGDDKSWLAFLIDDLPGLEAKGWRIEYEDSFRHQIATADRWYGEVDADEGGEWFDISLGVDVDGEQINLLPALVGLLQSFPQRLKREGLAAVDDVAPLLLTLDDGRLLPVPVQRLRHILDALLELYEADALDEKQRLRLHRFQAAQLAELDDERLHWRGDDAPLHLGYRLRAVDRIEEVAPPEGLQAVLRDYQRRGLDWLQFLREYALAGILADDMGLGKTVQTLAHLLLEKEQGRLDRPSLVIAPTSLMVNWPREAARFAPSLKVLTLHGPARRERFDAIPNYDVVLTTYPLLYRDNEALLAHHYHLLILDEAQFIKNPKAKASIVARQLVARHRLCLTGTPMENHLGELWSLFDFLLPGLLGSQKQFRRVFRGPIEKSGDEVATEQLARRVRPFLLRRTKEAVIAELPPKTEILRSVELEGEQRDLYESIRLAMHERVRREVADKGLARSQIVILDALLKLRQVCCDPRLVKMDSARRVKNSAKLNLLMDLLPEMIDEGRRVLLFSQFTGMLKLIEEAVNSAGIDYVTLTGQTRDRATPVERFQSHGAPLFLISLKAGGVGLNLTAADTVIHYDPWWNPAVERQATDRAHRIGQDNPVFVYKLISEGTVEEKIQAMQHRKQALADGLYGDKGMAEPQWTEQDVAQLFAPLAG